MAANHTVAVNFSTMFEQVCNFIAVSEVGDAQATMMGLVKLCLLDSPKSHFSSPIDFRSEIERRYGILALASDIESALGSLTDHNEIDLQGNQYYVLNEPSRANLKREIDNVRKTEEDVKNHWREEIERDFPELPFEKAWAALRKYLSRVFRRHGIQATSLLDPTLSTPVEYEEGLNSILMGCVQEDFADIQVQQMAFRATSSFLADGGRESERTRYIIQLANAAFAFYTVEIAPEAAATFRKNVSSSVVFLDTNFLFGILGLHNNSQVDVSMDLVEAVSKYNLPFDLRYHEYTLLELERTLHHHGERLKSRTWSKALSKAAVVTQMVSGIDLKYHEMNLAQSISPDDFLRPYQHCDVLLNNKGIKAYASTVDCKFHPSSNTISSLNRTPIPVMPER